MTPEHKVMKKLLEYLEDYYDEGPEYEGWKSNGLEEAIKEAEQLITASQPAPAAVETDEEWAKRMATSWAEGGNTLDRMLPLPSADTGQAVAWLTNMGWVDNPKYVVSYEGDRSGCQNFPVYIRFSPLDAERAIFDLGEYPDLPDDTGVSLRITTGAYAGDEIDTSTLGALRAAPLDAERDILAERKRQIGAEGWTHQHDDHHDAGEMARAAGLYALIAGSDAATYRNAVQGLPLNDYGSAAMSLWPWDRSWFKPTNRRRDLVKAAALIIAEIERIDRATLRQKEGK